MTKLKELSIPFRSIDLSVEHDFEIVLWKYSVVSIELEIREEIFDKILSFSVRKPMESKKI